MKEFLDKFKTILLVVKAEHKHVDRTTCTCGFKPQTTQDWDQHVADAQARNLISFIWEK